MQWNRHNKGGFRPMRSAENDEGFETALDLITGKCLLRLISTYTHRVNKERPREVFP